MVPSKSDGSASRPTLRSSPAPAICEPFILTETKPGPKPLTVTYLPSPSERCSVTPGRRRSDSATFWSTKLPRSSVEITELKPSFIRSKSRACKSACFTPFTSIISTSLCSSVVVTASVTSCAVSLVCATLENAAVTARASVVHLNMCMCFHSFIICGDIFLGIATGGIMLLRSEDLYII